MTTQYIPSDKHIVGRSGTIDCNYCRQPFESPDVTRVRRCPDCSKKMKSSKSSTKVMYTGRKQLL